jgi:hypothetical protein
MAVGKNKVGVGIAIVVWERRSQREDQKMPKMFCGWRGGTKM